MIFSSALQLFAVEGFFNLSESEIDVLEPCKKILTNTSSWRMQKRGHSMAFEKRASTTFLASERGAIFMPPLPLLPSFKPQ